MHYTWPLTSAKTWCPCGQDALVNMSVFYANLRLWSGGKATAARLVRSIIKNKKNRTGDHQNCNQTNVLMGIGAISLLGF